MSENIITAHNDGTDNFELAGTLWKIQVPGSETGNQFSLVEAIAPPGMGSPVHRHPRADQAIYVLEGRLDIVTDSKTFSFAKGETGLIRRGTPHREVNSSHSETRFTTIHSPGFFSDFLRLAGTYVKTGAKVPPSSTLTLAEARKIVEIGLEFDTEILTPLDELVGQRK